MNESSQHDSENDLDAPPKLVTALKEASRRDVFVPPYVDGAIFKAARQYLGRPERRPLLHFRRWMLWPALAAACVLIACVARLLMTSTQLRYAREDLNHDGKVDILDSFALARELKTGKPLPATYDINGDGVVDERDIALIAAHAVQLKKDNGS
jgi:hypothetical protein